MPPRYAYWTILIDGTATAFRAKEPEELLPTLNQLRRKNEDVTLRYFAKGKLWDNPEQAEWAGKNARNLGEPRDRDWRPGGAHKDPRARFDKKPKRRDARPHDDRGDEQRADRTRESFDANRAPRKPWSPPPRREGERPLPGSAAPGFVPGKDSTGGRERDSRDREPRREFDKPARKPWTPKPPGDRRPSEARQPRDEWRDRNARPRDERPWTGKPPRKDGWAPKPDRNAQGRTEGGRRPGRENDTRDKWTPRPGGDRPQGGGGWRPKPGSDRPQGGGWKPRGADRQRQGSPEPRREYRGEGGGGWKPKPGSEPRGEGRGWRPAPDRKPAGDAGGWKRKPWTPRPEGEGREASPRPRRDAKGQGGDGWTPRPNDRPAGKGGWQSKPGGSKKYGAPKSGGDRERGHGQDGPKHNDWRKRPDSDEAVPRPKRDAGPDRPPTPERIVTKPKPPERG